MWREQARLSLPGRQGKLNEDGTVVRIEEGRALFAVLDGVSSVEESITGYKCDDTFVPGGFWAMHHVRTALERMDLATIEDAFDAVCRADKAYGELVATRAPCSDEDRWRLPAVAAIVVVTDAARGEFTWAQVADCMLMHERPDRARFVLENPMQGIDAVALEVFRAAEGNHGDERLKEVFRAQYQGRNQPGSYPVLDGAVNRDLIQSGRVLLSEVQRFALWSDGLHVLSDNMHAVGTAILTDGLDAWYRAVVAREEADPTCMNPLRFNNDDKSGLVIERA